MRQFLDIHVHARAPFLELDFRVSLRIQCDRRAAKFQLRFRPLLIAESVEPGGELLAQNRRIRFDLLRRGRQRNQDRKRRERTTHDIPVPSHDPAP